MRLSINTFLIILIAFQSGCATQYSIKSFPEGANVYTKDLITQEKKLIGPAPLQFKKTKEMGDVFFISIEKENFYTKEVLLTTRGSESISVEVNLDPIQDKNRQANNQNGDNKGDSQQPQSPQQKQDDKAKDTEARLALLENTIAIYKDALFSQRFSGNGGPTKYDRDRSDDVVNFLFNAQNLITKKQYKEALAQLDQAILIDEYTPQAHLLKGTAHYLAGSLNDAKLAWQRTLKIDPFNADAYKYLRVVTQKLGEPMPPERPSQLRVPASDPFSRSIR